MGWLFTRGSTRKGLIVERTKNWEAEGEKGEMVKTVCLAHCYRGNFYSGVLWTVWERVFTKDGQQTKPTARWIGCDLLRYQTGYGWGYKDMEESMHPYYYSCPKKYLDLVPIDQFGGCEKWREGVKEYHRRQKERRLLGVGDTA
jgi:hypothetical protein